MKLRHGLAAGGVAALLLLSVAAPAAVAYQGQVANQVTVTGPAGTTTCNTSLTVTAIVLDSQGLPVANLAVVWSFGAGQVTGDQIAPTSTTTNASGAATTAVILACTVGNRTVVATAAPSSGQLVLSPEFVEGATGTPVASATPAASEIAMATVVPSSAATAATAAPGSPTTGTTSGTPWWVWLLVILLILTLGIVGVWFLVRRGVFAGH